MNFILIPWPSLENTSEEIQSNKPYPRVGIWLYHFNFVISMSRKTDFNALFFYNIKM
jgi:hypothetical protein